MKITFTIQYNFEKGKENDCLECKHFSEVDGCLFNDFSNAYGECNYISNYCDNGYKGSNLLDIEYN